LNNKEQIITSAFAPIIEVESEHKLDIYMERVYKLTFAEIFIELSNVMSARHNLMQMAAFGQKRASEVQNLSFDLEQKALTICILVFGDEFDDLKEGSVEDFVEVILAMDESVAKLNLDPETHGRKLCDRLGAFIGIEDDERFPSIQKFEQENNTFNEMMERMNLGIEASRRKAEVPHKEVISIRAVIDNKYSAPFKIYLTQKDIKLPKRFVLRIDPASPMKNGEEALRINNINYKLIATHQLDYINEILSGFDRYQDGVRIIHAVLNRNVN
jgi:hypothetical protein